MYSHTEQQSLKDVVHVEELGLAECDLSSVQLAVIISWLSVMWVRGYQLNIFFIAPPAE